ncbi:MAG TPA: hypothetical protein VFQ22_06535 [Longimicrobiales bacterium]|nr:hypothetical protein [Longimicrobiales bacterium]
MDPRAAFSVLAVLLPPPAHTFAQAPDPRTPEEYAARAEAAERAPLFQSEEPLRMTLRTDIEYIRDERDDENEVEGTVTFVDLDGSTVTRPVDVRARGNFRRDPRNCNFPPLRLDFPRGEMAGTVFEGQNRLKLVTPCWDNRDADQRYVYDEYLAYRIFNLLTSYSYRVRLVEITYEDVEGDYDTRTKHGFLIESDEQMADRIRGIYMEAPQMHPRLADGAYSALVAVFNYMIGNLDWSPTFFHNTSLVRLEGGRYITVPYDFDFSGLVNTRYSGPPPELMGRVKSVRARLFRGYCVPELRHDLIAATFAPRREAIERLYREFPHYEDEDHAEDALDYLEDFWRVIDDPRQFENRILHDCRPLPA